MLSAQVSIFEEVNFGKSDVQIGKAQYLMERLYLWSKLKNNLDRFLL